MLTRLWIWVTGCFLKLNFLAFPSIFKNTIICGLLSVILRNVDVNINIEYSKYILSDHLVLNININTTKLHTHHYTSTTNTYYNTHQHLKHIHYTSTMNTHTSHYTLTLNTYYKALCITLCLHYTFCAFVHSKPV